MTDRGCALCGKQWSEHTIFEAQGWPRYVCPEGVRPSCECGRVMRLDYWVWTVSNKAEMVCDYCQNRKLAG